MLSAKQRLNRSAFAHVLKRGRSVHGPHLSLKTAALPTSASGPQFSIVVSKRVAKTSVARHKLRRRLYGVLEPFARNRSPHGGIFFAKTGASALPLPALRAEAEELLSRAGF